MKTQMRATKPFERGKRQDHHQDQAGDLRRTACIPAFQPGAENPGGQRLH